MSGFMNPKVSDLIIEAPWVTFSYGTETENERHGYFTHHSNPMSKVRSMARESYLI